MSFWTILRQENHRLWGGKCPTVAFVLLLPLLFCFLFGGAYAENVVKHIPLVIYDQDQSVVSRTLIQAYTDSDRFSAAEYVTNQEDFEASLKNQEAMVGLQIPVDFSKKIKMGQGGSLLLVANSANNMFANAAITAAQEINRSFSIGVGQKLVEGLNQLPTQAMKRVYPLRMGLRILHNPTNGYTPFMLSGLILNGLQISLLLVVGPLLLEECRQPRGTGLWLSGKVFLAKGLVCWGAGLLSYGLSFLMMHLFFAVPVRGSFLDLFLMGAGFSFFVVMVLAMFAAVSPNAVMSLQIPLLYIMPGLLFSGLSWPGLSMNSFARFFSALLPMYYAADPIRDLLLAGYTPQLFSSWGSMMLGGALTGGLAWGIFSWRWSRTIRREGC